MSSSIRVAEEVLSRRDPVIASLVKQYGPCTLQASAFPFDVFVSTIVGQQLSGKAADTIVSRIETVVGTRPFDAKSLLNADQALIRACGVSAAKSRTILGLARAVDDGLVHFDGFDEMEDEGVILNLTKLWGIGQWTAEMFLIFGLGRQDVLSTSDAGLARAHRQLYESSNDTARHPCRLAFTAEAWRPYRSIASWYLWRTLD